MVNGLQLVEAVDRAKPSSQKTHMPLYLGRMMIRPSVGLELGDKESESVFEAHTWCESWRDASAAVRTSSLRNALAILASSS